MKHIVKLQQFEGPLDLLVYLIEKDEIDIYDIPVSKVTGQYLSYIKGWKELNIEVVSEYFTMASYLLHIKSEMLLFRGEDDAGSDIDPREELVTKLLEYKRFKKASEELDNLYKKSSSLIAKIEDYNPEVSVEWTIDDELTKYDLLMIFSQLIESKGEVEPLSVTITLEDVEKVSDKLLGILCENEGEIMSITEIIEDNILKDIEFRMRVVLILVSVLQLLKERKIFINMNSINNFYVGFRDEQIS